jgi:cytochrome c-type biogenesis protein CcmH
MRMNKFIIFAFLLMSFSVKDISYAGTGESIFSSPLQDPILEEQAHGLFKELRCVVCQGQSIEDSHADLALDMQALIREKLKNGDSPDQIKEFLHSRYGDFILLKPPFDGVGAFIWILPLSFMGILCFFVWKLFRRKNA